MCDFTIDSDVVELVDLLAKLALAAAGLYLAHSVRRHVTLRVSERRLEAYAALWEVMSCASPTRLFPGGDGPLTARERASLHAALLKWYYDAGNGMLLAGGTRTVFLMVKDNLIRPPEQLKPATFRSEVLGAASEKAELIRGERSMRQLSMLRTRMKADLRVFGIQYRGGLEDSDKDFLRACGEKLWKRPWRKDGLFLPLAERMGFMVDD